MAGHSRNYGPVPEMTTLPRDVSRCEGLNCPWRDTCARFTQLTKDYRNKNRAEYVGAPVMPTCTPEPTPTRPEGFILDAFEEHMRLVSIDGALRRLRTRKPPTLRQHLRGSR